MARKTIELRLTEDNIRTELKAGDVIVGAEELGTVVFGRPTIHNNGTAFVYFMGGYCERETFGVPQTVQVLRETEPEFEWSGRPLGTHAMVEISKTGGGTVGRRYIGRWSFRATLNNKIVGEGNDQLHTGTPRTHEEAARLVWGFLDSAYAAEHED